MSVTKPGMQFYLETPKRQGGDHVYNLPNGEEKEKREMPQPRPSQPGTEAAREAVANETAARPPAAAVVLERRWVWLKLRGTLGGHHPRAAVMPVSRE